VTCLGIVFAILVGWLFDGFRQICGEDMTYTKPEKTNDSIGLTHREAIFWDGGGGTLT